MFCPQLFVTLQADMEYTLNCNGKLLALSTPQVMGILNATPDSFYAGSRSQTEQEIAERTHQIPDSEPATEEEEMVRLRMALAIVRREAPDAIISVDTYRPDVARMVVEEFGADIINDVGGPVTSHFSPLTSGMFRMVSRLGVPYIYMSRKISCWTVQRWWTPCARWDRRILWWTLASALARRWTTITR